MDSISDEDLVRCIQDWEAREEMLRDMSDETSGTDSSNSSLVVNMTPSYMDNFESGFSDGSEAREYQPLPFWFHRDSDTGVSLTPSSQYTETLSLSDNQLSLSDFQVRFTPSSFSASSSEPSVIYYPYSGNDHTESTESEIFSHPPFSPGIGHSSYDSSNLVLSDEEENLAFVPLYNSTPKSDIWELSSPIIHYSSSYDDQSGIDSILDVDYPAKESIYHYTVSPASPDDDPSIPSSSNNTSSDSEGNYDMSSDNTFMDSTSDVDYSLRDSIPNDDPSDIDSILDIDYPAKETIYHYTVNPGDDPSSPSSSNNTSSDSEGNHDVTSDSTSMDSTTAVDYSPRDRIPNYVVNSASPVDESGNSNNSKISSSENDVDDEPCMAIDQSGGTLGNRSYSSYYNIRQLNAKFIKKYNTNRESWQVGFRLEEVQPRDLHQVLVGIFNEVIDRVADDLEGEDRIRVVFMHPALDRPINLPLMNMDQLDAERIISEIERVIQSNEGFQLDENFTMDVIKIKLPRGGKWTNTKVMPIHKLLRSKKSVVMIKNNDNLCLARALVVSRAKVDNDENYKKLTEGRLGKDGTQRQAALQLVKDANLPTDRKLGLKDVQKFQDILPLYQIVVMSKMYFNAIVYAGPQILEKRLYVYHIDDHFHSITSITGFTGRSYYCKHCERGYDHQEKHSCAARCSDCCQEGCRGYKVEQGRILCRTCQRSFGHDICYNNHLQKIDGAKSVCEKVFLCRFCQKKVYRSNSEPEKHHCGQYRCTTCSKWIPLGTNHECFMMPIKPKRQNIVSESSSEESEEEGGSSEMYKLFYFDIEADNEDIHLCNCIVVKSWNGSETLRFYGDACLEEFIEWCLGKKNARIIAHNFSGYDSYFVVEGLAAQGICPKVVPRGGKILSLEIPGTRTKFIDSLNFIPLPLRKLPQAFGFANNIMKKGDFPHKMNRAQYQDYDGPMPPKELWEPDIMKTEQRLSFEKWYQQKVSETYRFVFKDELISYCENDVEVLRLCVNCFRDEFEETTGHNPFEKSITIPSACMAVFRRNFLQEDTVAIIPPEGYKTTKYSMKALYWILYEEYITGTTIAHARNGGEIKVHGQKVDGWSECENLAYQFMGCWYHGCVKCYARKTENRMLGKSMEELYNHTMIQVEKLQQKGIKVKVMWEHEWDANVREQSEVKEFISQMDIAEPLMPKEGFYGGRTEALCRFYEVSSDVESVKYLDFMSLYPSVMKYGTFPVGHPQIFVGSEIVQSVEDYFGLAKVKILPPRDLYIPVLPYRYEGKLYFPLCKMCISGHTEVCTHSENERALEGTWVTLEIRLALQQGYKVLKVDEVWHWSKTSSNLFEEYVNTFLTKKIEASGWPDSITSAEEKNLYVEEINRKENINVSPGNINKYPGKRLVAKLCLNSFWGKFAQNPKCTQSTIVTTAKEYFDLLLSDKEEVKDLVYLNDEVVEIKHAQTDAAVSPLPTGNTALAAFTTAQARIKLYQAIHCVGERLLYMDTDSMIFISREGLNHPPEGNALGDLQSELQEGDSIDKFVCGGAKNYAFHTKRGEVTLKVRGFTMNKSAQQALNMESMSTHVLHHTVPFNVDMGSSIRRVVRDRKLKTYHNVKRYRMVFDKRLLNEETHFSVPYGFRCET